jgi:hypothetical protein
MRLIQSIHLIQWADQKDAELFLPLLLRKLIIASCDKFPEITIPAIDSIYKPGVDGRCLATDGGLYVPQGLSFWEFGRGEDFKDKYRRDFDKRKLEIADNEKQEAAFIFVTLRRWVKEPLKDDQSKADENASAWKSVRILDADDLETWLEQCPQVAAWLSVHLKITTASVEATDHYWNRIAVLEGREISSEFVLAGRQVQKEGVIAFIDNGSGRQEVQGISRDETIVFIIAAYISQGDEQLQSFFAHSIIVNDAVTLREICANQRGLVIIYDPGDDQVIDNIKFNNNKILYPVSYRIHSNGLSIPIPKTCNFVVQLETFGIDHRRANRIAKECGKSLIVISRYLSNTPGRVSWSQGLDPAELIPLFLVQRIDSNREGDRLIIETLSGESFDNYLQKIKKWSLIFDKPVIQVANVWQVTAPYDLLFVIGRQITEDQLNRLREVFFMVIGETDPALSLEPNMRYAAVLFNKTSVFSRGLKKGLCSSLVLLSLFSRNAGLNVSFNIENRIAQMISQLLHNKEVAFWQSIEGFLNILAEAAPGAYLDALEALLKNYPDILTAMFDDTQFDLFTPTYHSHILWSLEALAWDKAYLSRVSIILCNLVLIDKGTKTANRPINSLKHIFSVWLPQTYVLAEERRKTLRMLSRKNSVAAFQLLLELILTGRDIGMYNYQPMWRLREYYPLAVTNSELIDSVSFLAELAVELAGNDAGHWSKLVDHVPHFYGKARQQLLDAFSKVTEFQGNLYPLREELYDLTRRHKAYHEQDWALPISDRKQLEAIYESLCTRKIEKYAWCFNTDMIESRRADQQSLEEMEKRILEKRQSALKQILSEDGIEGVIELAPHIKRPFALGQTLATIDLNYANAMVDLLWMEKQNEKQLAISYLNYVGYLAGIIWITKLCSGFVEFDIDRRAQLFAVFSPSNELFDLIESDPGQADSYWKVIFKNFHPYVPEQVLKRCVTTLNSYGRFISSANLIDYRYEKVNAQLIYDTLEGMISNPMEEGVKPHISEYNIGKFFERLDHADDVIGNMALLEWKYFDLLESDGGHGRGIKYIFPALVEQPKFFAQVVSWIYKPENKSMSEEIAEVGIEGIANRARLADSVLEAWDQIPGEDTTGTINFDVLKRWCLEVIEECKKLDRTDKGFYKIGQLLGQLRDGNSNWPQSEICEMIETLDNEHCSDGFEIGVINGRGPRVRIGPASDGSVEAAQSAYYQSLSDKLSIEYPVVARLMSRIAENYGHDSNYMRTREAQQELE